MGAGITPPPPSLLRPSPSVPAYLLAVRSRAGRLLSLWLFVLRKNTALSRGW